MKVRATRRGQYGAALRRPGAVFTLVDPAHFNPSWMQEVDASIPENYVTARDAITQLTAERPIGLVRRVCEPVEDDGGDDDRALTEFDPFE
jgi:hypothetical protein